MSKRINILGLLIVLVGCGYSFAYTIDGSLDDWGLDLSTGRSQNETWLPSSGVSFIVEDNRDPQYGGTYPLTGVHIKGVGSFYTRYDEPLVLHRDGVWVAEPYGSDYYDLEALYFDEDDDYIYVAVVTGEAPDALGDARPGDLALNLDGDVSTGEYGYEYGIKLGSKTGLEQFAIYSVTDWEEPFYIPDNKPSLLLAGTKVGMASGAYVDSLILDNGKTNYVIELAIPKSAVGNPDSVTIGKLFISEGCGNDHIIAPELPILIATLLLVSPAFAYLLVRKN